MSELDCTAFHFCSKAEKKGLKKCEVLRLVEGSLTRLRALRSKDAYRWNLSKEVIDTHTEPLAGLSQYKD
jgi:hypothetical protein